MEQSQTVNDNPFLPPSHPFEAQTHSVEEEKAYYFDASTGKRFLNFFLDRIFATLLGGLVGVALGLWAVYVIDDPEMHSLNWLFEPGGELILGIVIYLSYMLIFESICGFTPAKLITGTRVVKFDAHEKPGFSTIFIRNICRYIPFEPFSFLGGTPRGWHDTISKTRVVDIRKPPLQNEDYESLPDYLKNT